MKGEIAKMKPSIDCNIKETIVKLTGQLTLDCAEFGELISMKVALVPTSVTKK